MSERTAMVFATDPCSTSWRTDYPLVDDPRALAQSYARRRPARHRCPVSRLRHLEVVHTGDMLDDTVGHAEGEVRLGQV
jgi:hypothetical protein